MSEENVERVRNALVNSPNKSTRRASKQLQMPVMTVCTVLRRRLAFKPYKLQLVQALTENDKEVRKQFCEFLIHDLDNDESFLSKIVFSDEETFHINDRVNRHNVRIWRPFNQHATIEVECDSPIVIVFCAMSHDKIIGTFFFHEKTLNVIIYLDMLEIWLLPQLEESGDFILQQDGAPSHWHLAVRGFLNDKLPYRWIGRRAPQDLGLHQWPPRSPGIIPYTFFSGATSNIRCLFHSYQMTLTNLRHAYLQPFKLSHQTC